MEIERERNINLDLIRGFAILLVILGHTISTNNLAGFDNSVLFKIIFSIQMPLFIIVSGYVTFYTRPIKSIKDFIKYLKKRTMAYLLPWFVWSVIIQGILLSGWSIYSILPNILNLLWHMDSGYWFLFSLWTICMIWGIASFLANRLTQNPTWNVIATTVISLFPALGLLLLGRLYGFSFLAIKLSIYYLPFYFIGYYFSRGYPWLKEKQWYVNTKEIIYFTAVIVYSILILFFNTYLAKETITEIALRIICSLSGCVVIICFINYLTDNTKQKAHHHFNEFLATVGQQSLGLYLSHNLFLNVIKLEQETALNSFAGFEVCFVNYIITVMLSSLFILVVSSNKISKFALWGKS